MKAPAKKIATVTALPAKPEAPLLVAIAQAASNPDVDVEKMERLFAMHGQMQDRQAEVEFNGAMNQAQSEMGRVSADADNRQTSSKYATYGKLDKALRPIYARHGFSLSFDTQEAPSTDLVLVVCYVSHKGGHTRTYRALVPADGKGAKGGDVMTKTHAFGSATSYGMRYLLKMIFNVAIGEEDNDGNGAEDNLPAKKARHDAAFGRHSESIAFIKDRLAAEDWKAAADEWRAIGQDDRIDLWLAPTKGGCLTTLERTQLHTKLPPIHQDAQ